MGVFGAISNSVYKVGPGRKLAKKAYRLQKAKINSAIAQNQRQMDFLSKTEHPRQQAFLKQSMFGRGLGKSTIFDQDKSRMTTMQRDTMQTLSERRMILYRTKAYMKKQRKVERVKLYMDIGADVLDTALSVFTGGMNQPGAVANSNYGNSFSGPDANMYGGPDYYGGGSMYA